MPDKLSVREKIAEQLANITPSVIDQIVETVAARETNKRAEAILKVIDKLEVAEKEMKKLERPDQVFYNDKNEVDVAVFSEGRKNERLKKAKLIERLTNAINKAIDKEDMQDVYNLAGGKDPDRDEDKGTPPSNPPE